MHRHPEHAQVALRALLEHVPIEVAIFDAELRCTHINAPLGRSLGMAPADAVGRTVSEAFPGLAAAEADIRRVLETAEPALDVRAAGTVNGEERCWQASYYPLLRDDGGVGGVIAIGMRDGLA
jgi:PAS domain S-box-containing protein